MASKKTNRPSVARAIAETVFARRTTGADIKATMRMAHSERSIGTTVASGKAMRNGTRGKDRFEGNHSSRERSMPASNPALSKYRSIVRRSNSKRSKREAPPTADCRGGMIMRIDRYAFAFVALCALFVSSSEVKAQTAVSYRFLEVLDADRKPVAEAR